MGVQIESGLVGLQEVSLEFGADVALEIDPACRLVIAGVVRLDVVLAAIENTKSLDVLVVVAGGGLVGVETPRGWLPWFLRATRGGEHGEHGSGHECVEMLIRKVLSWCIWKNEYWFGCGS